MVDSSDVQEFKNSFDFDEGNNNTKKNASNELFNDNNHESNNNDDDIDKVIVDTYHSSMKSNKEEDKDIFEGQNHQSNKRDGEVDDETAIADINEQKDDSENIEEEEEEYDAIAIADADINEQKDNNQEDKENNNNNKKEKNDDDNDDGINIPFDEEEDEGETVEKLINSENGNINWMLDSPAPMYDNFYQEKKEFLDYILRGKQLPFEEYKKELENSAIDISGAVFDNKLNLEKMDKVHQLKNRVCEIQMQCNGQYYKFRRFIDIIRGMLSRIRYEKPKIKQEGLYSEHMKDLELYFTKLEDLHDSAEKVMENLQATYEQLSRRITVAMDQKGPSRYSRNDSKEQNDESKRDVQDDNSNIKEYDSLDSGNDKIQNEDRNTPKHEDWF